MPGYYPDPVTPTIDLFSAGSTPPAAPPTGTDLIFIGRPGVPQGVPYVVSLATLGSTLTSLQLPVVFVTATGATQATATPLQVGCVNIVTGGAGGVALPNAAQGLIVQNQTGAPVLLYPPLNPAAATFLNGQGAGIGSPLNPGAEVAPRTADGITWYVGG